MKCPVCKSEARSVWGKRAGVEIFECKACTATYFDRDAMPTIPNDYQDYHPDLVDYDSDRYQQEFRIRAPNFKFELLELASLVNGKELLDIGAGVGYFCKQASDLGWNAKGVELSEEAKANGVEQFSIQYTELDSVAPDSIDVITCHHVIEHLVDPANFVARLYECLKQGGVLAVHVPNQESLTSYLKNSLSGTQRDKSCSLYMPDHLTGFTKSSLHTLTDIGGFEAISLRDVALWSRYYDPFFLDYLLTTKQYSAIAKKALRGCIDHLGSPFDKGDWVIGLFRKPTVG